MKLPGRLSVSTYTLQELPLREAIMQLLCEGWTGIEVMCEGPHQELLEWREEELRKLVSMLQEHGVSLSLHAPITGCNPAAGDARSREASTEVLLKTLQIAQVLGSPYVVLHPGERETAGESGTEAVGGQESAEAEHRTAAFIRNMLELTKDSPVIIALENVPPYPGLYGTEPGFLGRVIEKVDSPRLRVVFDTGHSHLTGGERWQAFIEVLLSHIVTVHASDNNGLKDEHLRLGEGTIPGSRIVSTLVDGGFAGWWVCENKNPADAKASAEELGDCLEALV
jgi:sugar phosphate isomerase/epimerase